MKNHMKIGLAILIAISLVSCADQGSLKAGAATGKSMLKLIPASARMVFMVDVHRSLTADAVAKALQDEKMKQKYDDFVKMAGLDPMKDIYFLAAGLAGMQAGKEQEGAIILNLRYNKEQLLAKLKEAVKGLQEETYNGLTLYKGIDAAKPGKMAPAGAFLDDSNIVLGNDKTVRAVVDVYQKKADSLDKSPEMKKLLKSVNTSANVWAAIAIPEGMLKQAAEKNPMLKDLVGVTGLTLSLDYANKTLTTEIQSLGGTKEQNKTLAERLSAFKSMGALATAKLPLQGELLNSIEISSGADHVKIYTSISAELLEKIRTMAQEKLGGLMQMNPQAPKEEKKEEKKAGAEVKK
jgi:hypothetical protein